MRQQMKPQTETTYVVMLQITRGLSTPVGTLTAGTCKYKQWSKDCIAGVGCVFAFIRVFIYHLLVPDHLTPAAAG